MAKKYYGGIDIQTNSKLRLFESTGANFTSLRSPASMAADLDLRLPATDLANGAMVSDGSGNLSLALILNANIDAAAAIAYSKLALTGAIVSADLAGSIDATKIADGSVTSAEFQRINSLTSNAQDQIDGKASLSGATFTGDVYIDDEKLLKFGEEDANGTDFIAMKAPAAIAASVTYTLPEAPATSGFVLASTTGGVMSWVNNASTAAFKTDWATADTATFAITHSLNTLDVKVEVYDKATGATIEVDAVVRTSVNVVTVTASEAPPAGSWRVLILAV